MHHDNEDAGNGDSGDDRNPEVAHLLVRVPAANASRRCSACQDITEGSRQSRDRFVCKAPGCGYAAHADTNAARNVEHAVKQQAPRDIVGARTWSPRRQAG
ncbi:zinc ribbon domain-containing protein [Nocardiopsis synnemataformans]|uniref:zinc ribbon domain-containing protein n=1 Tax=Nocardiopsis synnemataformans TaxID=61305 RepID=UPI003EB8A5DF